MSFFTITKQYLLPVYQRVVVEAESLEEACEKVLATDDWDHAEEDYETARPTTIEAIAEGQWSSPYDAPIALLVLARFCARG